MINGLGVLGWGVGGIEAEAAMLGQPVTMLIPQVIGVRLLGTLKPGATATDLVLTVTELLRKKGVVDKFVEFFGDGLANLPLADRATIGNMSPEFGSTCAIFPIDEETLRYLTLSGRRAEHVRLVEDYARAQDLWRKHGAPPAQYSDVLELDLGTSSPRLRARVVRKIGCRCALPRALTRSTARAWPRSAASVRLPARAARPAPRRVGDSRAGRQVDGSHRWRSAHRGDHQLHQHVEPFGIDGRGTSGAQRAPPRTHRAALGQDQPRAGLPGGHRLSAAGRTALSWPASALISSATDVPPASVTPAR